ncbi:hypothetical protein [Vibrio hepatarius]|jgi:hypothetical protein|uniref:Uncharacterized protein n=1 Tax=Vibrio hepatarius TaxID=171383 RepID=A0A0M0HRJ8_9VIBR|nr:hypothetical protein [Vibrio hepatarius]KOO04715.1 hypothetical protein AKJ31_21800 [Vibrio hepatarius]
MKRWWSNSTDFAPLKILLPYPSTLQASEHQQLGYVASGCSQGDLAVSPAPKESATRTIEVRTE